MDAELGERHCAQSPYPFACLGNEQRTAYVLVAFPNLFQRRRSDVWRRYPRAMDAMSRRSTASSAFSVFPLVFRPNAPLTIQRRGVTPYFHSRRPEGPQQCGLAGAGQLFVNLRRLAPPARAHAARGWAPELHGRLGGREW